MNAPSHAASAAPPALPPTLVDLAEEYYTNAITVREVLESSAHAERTYLRRFFDWFGPPDSPRTLFSRISADSVTECLIDYASKYGPGSRCCMQKTVRLFLRFSYLAGYLRRDLSALSPTVRVPRMGKVVRGIPQASIEAVLAGIVGDTPIALRDRAILWLLSTYGVRGVQIRRLRLEDVDWSRGRIHFPAAKRGRTLDEHLTPKAGNRLAEYIRKGRPSSPHREVFLAVRKPFKPIRRSCELTEIIRKRIARAGVKLPEGVGYGSHAFRHAFASRLYGRVPFKDVIDMMGHRKPSTTLMYGKVDLVGLRKAALAWPGGPR
jgi:integrase